MVWTFANIYSSSYLLQTVAVMRESGNTQRTIVKLFWFGVSRFWRTPPMMNHWEALRCGMEAPDANIALSIKGGASSSWRKPLVGPVFVYSNIGCGVPWYVAPSVVRGTTNCSFMNQTCFIISFRCVERQYCSLLGTCWSLLTHPAYIRQTLPNTWQPSLHSAPQKTLQINFVGNMVIIKILSSI